MIRQAKISDLPRLQIMGAKFFKVSGLDKWFSFKPRSFSQLCTRLMENDQAVILVAEREIGAIAMAAALAYPCWFNEDHLTAQELFWWVEPEFRGGQVSGQLHRGLEDWARSRRCLTMEMGALEASRPEALAALYKRKGYGAKESIFCKRLVA